jgi:tRNA G37 N-methylase Trm5
VCVPGLAENVARNHVEKNCHIIQGDALDTALLPRKKFNRLIIPAPYGMDRAPDLLQAFLAGGGMIHFDTFRPKEPIPGIIAAYEEKGSMSGIRHPAETLRPVSAAGSLTWPSHGSPGRGYAAAGRVDTGRNMCFIHFVSDMYPVE